MPQSVQGDKNSGDADPQSAPVKAGGKYNATQPTFADGQRADFQVDTRGNLLVTVAAPNAAAGIPAAVTAMVNTSLSASTAISLTNPGYAGVNVFMNITSAFPGSASTTYALKIAVANPLSAGSRITVAAATPRSASGATMISFYPNLITTVSAPYATANGRLPASWFIIASLSTGATSKEVVMSLGYQYLP